MIILLIDINGVRVQMSVQKVKKWCFDRNNNFQLFNRLTLLLFPITLLPATTLKTLASEEVVIPPEWSDLDEPHATSQVTNVNQLRDV